MKKLTKKWQIILYGCSGIGVNMLNIIVGSYLCSALLTGGFKEHVESWTYMNKNLVVAGIWGVLILVAKIVDGLIDIPMSSFTDNLKTKWGRRKPAIIIGFVPMIIAYVLFLFPLNNTASVLNTIWFALILCLFYAFYTLTMVTYYATFAEIVETDKERMLLSNTKSICDVVYFSMSYALVPIFVNGGINIRIVALCAIPLSLSMIIPFFFIKEHSTKDEPVAREEGDAKGVNIFESFRLSVKDRPFMYWLCVLFVMNFGLQLFLSGINEFFSSTGISMIAVMASAFAPVPITICLYNKIVKKKGLGTGFRYVMVVFSAAMLLMLFCLPKTSKMTCNSALIDGLTPGTDYVVSMKVAVTDEEKESGAEDYSIVRTYKADQNGIIDLGAEALYDGSDDTFADYAIGSEIGLSQKKGWALYFAIACGVLASFAIGAFFSITYSVPSELAAEENKRSGKCASSIYFAVQGLFEGVSAGLSSGVVLVAIKTADKASYITVIVAAALMAAFGLSFFLSKRISLLGKVQRSE